MRQIINHFTDDDLYKLTMCCAVIDNYPRAHVRYQFVDRDDMSILMDSPVKWNTR